jgi:LDH2 family malate/lactate/ureidoglycolate dehydrogenase
MIENVRKHPQRKIETVRLTPISARINGGFESGYLSHHRATLLAIEIAREHGISLVGVNDSISSGRIAYYMEMVAKAGFVGIQFTGSQSVVAAHGGILPVFGTNPIAFAFPCDPEPVIFDIGTSATNGGDVRLARRLGESLPEGVAIDKAGRPTQDPNAVGAILPFGGYKGSGLAFIVQVFGMLGGAPLQRDGVRGWGSLFIVFKPELLMSVADFKNNLVDFVAEIKDGPRQAGVDEIRIPGERAFRERARRRKEGVEIDRAIYDALLAL